MDGVTLAVDVGRGDERLMVNYAMSLARGGEPRYLLTQRVVPDGFTTDWAYVCAAEPGTAILLQGPGPRLGNSLVTPIRPDVPSAIRLEPGTTVTATIQLALPLREWSGHQPPRHEGRTQPRDIDRLVVRLAYVRESAAFHAEPYQHFPGVYQVNGHPIEFLEAVATLRQSCQLLYRTDEFVRFAAPDVETGGPVATPVRGPAGGRRPEGGS